MPLAVARLTQGRSELTADADEYVPSGPGLAWATVAMISKVGTTGTLLSGW